MNGAQYTEAFTAATRKASAWCPSVQSSQQRTLLRRFKRRCTPAVAPWRRRSGFRVHARAAMDAKKGFCMFFVLAAIFALSMQAAHGAGDNGYSLGQPQALRKDRHLLAVDCNGSCGKRCAVAGVKDRCLKYCGICCNECGCVPSGTYGHRDECPCYRDKKNSKGKPKCP